MTLVESLSVCELEALESDEESELSDLVVFPFLEELPTLFDVWLESRLFWEFPEELLDEELTRSLEESFDEFDFFESPFDLLTSSDF